jgi:hypothetical protein
MRAPLLALLLPILPGCLDVASPSANDAEARRPTEPVFDAGTCAVSGRTLDDEFRPLAAAVIHLFGAGRFQATHADAHGWFTLNRLEPGPYRLTASAPGHEPYEQLIACEPGRLVELLATLARTPPDDVGYADVIGPLRGRIVCAIGFAYLQSQDLCRSLDAEAATVFTVATSGAPITAAAYEALWTPSGAFGGRTLSLTYPGINQKAADVTYETGNAHAPTAGRIWGEAPLRIILRTDGPNSLHPGANLTLNVRPHGQDPTTWPATLPHEGSSKLVADQSFDLWVTLFYRGADAPYGYTATA